MHGTVQDIHGEQAKQVAVEESDMDRWRIRGRRHQRCRDQAEQPGVELSDTGEQRKRFDSHSSACQDGVTASIRTTMIASKGRRTRRSNKVAFFFCDLGCVVATASKP